MRRILLAAAVGAALGAGGLSLASHGDHGQGTVTKLSERDVIETLNGKEARVTTVEVTLRAGSRRPAAPPSRARSSATSSKASSSSASATSPSKTLKAGETFYEPSGVLHRVSRNPSDKTRTRVLAVILHPRDAEQIATPAGKE